MTVQVHIASNDISGVVESEEELYALASILGKDIGVEFGTGRKVIYVEADSQAYKTGIYVSVTIAIGTWVWLRGTGLDVGSLDREVSTVTPGATPTVGTAGA